MEDLPQDVVINEILSRMSLPEIFNFCNTHPQWFQLCNSDQLWANLVKRDYPQFLPYNPEMHWKDYYIMIYTAPWMPFYIDNQAVARIKVTPYNLQLLAKGFSEFIQRQPYYRSEKYKIVFTDNFVTPVAYYENDELTIINPNVAPEKAVYLPEGFEVTPENVLSQLTGRYKSPLYHIWGFIDQNEQLMIGTDINQLNYPFGTPCPTEELGDVLDRLYHRSIPEYILNLLKRMIPRTDPQIPPRLTPEALEELCEILKRDFRARGLIINEVYQGPNLPWP